MSSEPLDNYPRFDNILTSKITQGLYDFAKTLFEQYSAALRSKFYNGRPFERGTGAFGPEIDDSDFICTYFVPEGIQSVD